MLNNTVKNAFILDRKKKSMSEKYVPFGSHEKAENIIKKFKIWSPQLELEFGLPKWRSW